MRIQDADQAMLTRSFPDTQVWNFNSEHEPRYGLANSRDNKVYNVVQSIVIRQWLIATSSWTSGAKTFTINDLAQVSTWLSVFDQYKIKQVEIWFKPSVNYYSNTNLATLYTVIDYDDAVNLPSENAALQYENMVSSPVNAGHYRRFQPHVETAVYQPNTFGGYKNELSGWIDAASPTVSHYGFKAGITPITGTTVQYDITIRYWVQFRNIF